MENSNNGFHRPLICYHNYYKGQDDYGKLLSFLTLTLFFFSDRFFYSFSDPPTFCPLSTFIVSVFVLITTAVLFLFRVSRIFFLTLSVSSPSYLRILIAQRLRVLFRLSFAQLMQQRLGKKSLFNAEVKDLLSSCVFQKLPAVTNIFWKSYIDYSCFRQASTFLFHGSKLTVVSNSIFNMMT